MPLGEWDRRLGALPVEAYHCFMVWVPLGPNRLQACGAGFARTQGRLPSDHQSSRTPIAGACRRVHVRQGQASGGAEEAPSLTAVARVGFGSLAVGAEENLRRGRTKERIQERKKEREGRVAGPLDKKSPIQAVCLNWARTDLCGGRRVTCVPTAIQGGGSTARDPVTDLALICIWRRSAPMR
jgi:hypothetical protein